jgi:hypothetical protein
MDEMDFDVVSLVEGYQPRERRTKSGMIIFRRTLCEIVAKYKPMSVRQVYYQAVVRELVPKTKPGYLKVQTALSQLRENHSIPYEYIADNTRMTLRPKTYRSPAQAAKELAERYRKSLWLNAGVYVEIWCEKDALSGVIGPITDLYDVPLMIARGYSSSTFAYTNAKALRELKVPIHIYNIGDHDPSGVDAWRVVQKRILEFAPNLEISFERVAVTPEQIEIWNLPTRETNQDDTRARNWEGESTEADAIEPSTLRYLVESTITQHLTQEIIDTQEAEEESEKAFLLNWAEALAGAE